MAMHANTPDDCLLVRHWVLLGEKSIPKESRWALGTRGLPQEGLNGCGMWAVGGQQPKYLLCLARSIQRRCCCGCWHAQGLRGGNPWWGGSSSPGCTQLPPALPPRGNSFQQRRRLFCARTGSAAWPYVNEPSLSDLRLGTRDTQGCSGARLHNSPSRDRAHPWHWQGIVVVVGGCFWHAQLRAASLACMGWGLQPAGRMLWGDLAAGPRFGGGGCYGVEGGLRGGFMPACLPAWPCRCEAGFISHCVNEH